MTTACGKNDYKHRVAMPYFLKYNEMRKITKHDQTVLALGRADMQSQCLTNLIAIKPQQQARDGSGSSFLQSRDTV